MKFSPRFLVAKYVPDPRRMEPKNIGVILWSHGQLAARFIGDDEEKIRAPKFVRKKNQSVYVEWVKYWRQALEDRDIVPVSRETPEFLDALRAKSRDHYILAEGGTILAPIPPEDIYDAAEELFEEFVGDERAKVGLHRVCDDLFRASLEKEQYEKDFPFEASVAGKVEHTFVFNYAGLPQGNLPRALFQRADLDQEGSVNSATFMFESAADKKMRKDQCGALVMNGSPKHENAKAMLGVFATIIDVADQDEARYVIRHMAGISGEPPAQSRV